VTVNHLRRRKKVGQKYKVWMFISSEPHERFSLSSSGVEGNHDLLFIHIFLVLLDKWVEVKLSSLVCVFRIVCDELKQSSRYIVFLVLCWALMFGVSVLPCGGAFFTVLCSLD
jgi:hypothetical protein